MTLRTLTALLGAAAIALLIALLASVTRQRSMDAVARRLVILLLIGLLSLVGCTFYYYSGMSRSWPRLSFMEIGLVYWIGPSLYFYARRVAGGPDPFRRMYNLIHWLPAVIVELLVAIYHVVLLDQDASALRAIPVQAIWLAFHLQLLTYIALSLRHLAKLGRQVSSAGSGELILDLRWMRLLCFGLTGQVVLERLLKLPDIIAPTLPDSAVLVAYLLIITLAYFALGQPMFERAPAERPSRGESKYSHSGLRDDSASYYLDKLEKLMATERCYLDSELSAHSLAARVGISAHHLSQILNGKLGKTYYDYINELRVKHARQLLADRPAQSITQTAYDSGYNSKNSFYNAFRRHTGMSPSEYRRRQRTPSGFTID